MRKSKFKITAMIAMIVCLALAVSLLAGCSGKGSATPYIGENGNWWIGDVDTGVKAAGPNGADGADGANGAAPHIGENGNWWFGDIDTGIDVAGQNGEIAEYTTPEKFGAVGDGVADDTAAVLSALKTGKPVFLRNTYKVTELDCTGIEKIVMYGKEDVTTKVSTSSAENEVYNIIFEGELLFKNAPEKLSIEQLRFYAKNAGTFIKTKISSSWINKCNFTNFGGMFVGGMQNYSNVSENAFVQLSGTFATDCEGSIVANNYIESALTARTTLFTGTMFARMYFMNNAVDYCKIAFGKYDNWEFNRIIDNDFDSIFRVFETETMFNDTTVTGNTFANIDYTLAKNGWGEHADTQMTSEDWSVFTITEKCNRVNISNNSGKATVALKMTSVNNPTNIYINLSGLTGSREFTYYNTVSAENSSIFVEDFDHITVVGDSLPSAALYDASGNPLTSFNKQHIYWQGNLYVNNNGTWVKLSNNG